MGAFATLGHRFGRGDFTRGLSRHGEPTSLAGAEHGVVLRGRFGKQK